MIENSVKDSTHRVNAGVRRFPCGCGREIPPERLSLADLVDRSTCSEPCAETLHAKVAEHRRRLARDRAASVRRESRDRGNYGFSSSFGREG